MMSRRKRPRHADRGASLLIVLAVITVVSLVMGVIVSQVGTAENTTVQLRDQASDNYGADAATNAVLTGLHHSTLNCNDPASPASVSLGVGGGTPFYVPAQSQEGSIDAYAQCTPDAIVGATTSTSQPPPVTSTTVSQPAPVTSTGSFLGSGDPTLPVYAILATASDPITGVSGASDNGLDITQSANNKTVCIENGSVGSNTKINASGETLAVRLNPSITGQGNSTCTTGTGVAPGGSHLVVNAGTTCQGTFTPTACAANQPHIPTPAAPPLPSSVGTTNPAVVCKTSGSKTYAAFSPGYYTTAATLSNPCGTGSNVFEWLSPGVYVFNFSGTTTWTWPTTMVAGTPIQNNGNPVSGLNPTSANTLTGLNNTAAAPNACQDPAQSSAAVGVEMLFAGASNIASPSSTTSQICASSPNNGPPVAIFGIPTATTIGATLLPGESMCTAAGCGTNSLITTDPSAQSSVYIRGFVYAPNGAIYMTMKNSNGQLFNWGIIVRDFSLAVNGSSPNAPWVQLPKPNTGVGLVITTSTPPPTTVTAVVTPPQVTTTSYNIRYVNVWTCLANSLSSGASCSHTGQPNLQVRVFTNGSTMTILSWNHIR